VAPIGLSGFGLEDGQFWRLPTDHLQPGAAVPTVHRPQFGLLDLAILSGIAMWLNRHFRVGDLHISANHITAAMGALEACHDLQHLLSTFRVVFRPPFLAWRVLPQTVTPLLVVVFWERIREPIPQDRIEDSRKGGRSGSPQGGEKTITRFKAV
jgi:hypothetical protein